MARRVMFFFCFSTPEPRCWLAGRALALASLDARLTNMHELFYFALFLHLG